MRRLIFFLLVLLTFSCGQDSMKREDDSAITNENLKVWHQRDTLINPEIWSKDSVRQISLNITERKNFHLKAKSDAPIYLFSGGKIMAKSSEGNLEYSLDGRPDGEVFLSLDKNVRKLSYGLYSIKNPKLNNAYSQLNNAKREDKWISNNILLILLLGASFFMVIIKLNYDRHYFKIISFSKIFNLRLNEGDQSRVRIMDRDNLVFAGFYVFLTAGLIYFLSLSKSIGFFGEAKGMIEFLKILLALSIGLIGKVVLVAIVSNLFGNNKLPAFYIKEMLNINLFFVITLFFSSVLIFLYAGSIPAFWLSTVIYGLVVFYLIRLILLYFKILKLSSFTNLYLFSYFCTTEIFPFLIGLKYFMR